MSDRLPGMNPPRGEMPRGGICIIAGDPQSVDVTASTLPAKTAVGTSVGSLFGTPDAGFIIPLGNYAGINWTRSGRSKTGTGSDAPAIPLVPGVPVVLARGREIYLNRSGQVTAAGVCELVFYPVSNPKELNDPYFLAALAQAFGGGAASSATISGPFPAATALNDADPNPTTTRVGANALVWYGGATIWQRWIASTINTAVANTQAGVPLTYSCEHVEDAAGNMRQQRGFVGDTDALALVTAGQLGAVAAIPFGLNLSNVNDRQRSSGYQAAQDNYTVPTLGLNHVLSFQEVLNNRSLAAERMRQPDAYADGRTVASAASTASTGVKLSLTCPANTSIRIKSATAYHLATAGAVVVDLGLTPNGGARTVIQRLNPAALAAGNAFDTTLAIGNGSNLDIRMTAGDVLDWTCVVAVASTTFDFTISYEQTRYPI